MDLEYKPFYTFEETAKLIELPEIITEEIRIEDVKERSIKSNYFLTKPQGIIIHDSWNNFLFPVRPIPRLDTNKCDLPVLTKRLRELYLKFKSDYLPWHYVIELIGDRYTVFNTRPINIRFPKKHDEIMNSRDEILFDVEWDEETEKFMNEKIFLIEEGIHVCILGDTSVDVYPKQFYKLLGTMCIKPFIHYFRLPQTYRTRTFGFNLGSKFKPDFLFKFMYK